MKKFFFILCLLFSLPSFSEIQGNGNILVVDGFVQSTQFINAVFQKNTGLKSSCGLTSLLLVSNFFNNKDYGEPYYYLTTIPRTQDAVKRLYDYLGYSYNSTVSTIDLKNISINKWGWNLAKIASGSNLLSVNEESMKQSFIDGYPIIVPIKGSSIYNPLYDPNQKNPAINNHFVVFYAYTIKPSTYYFFDPYYGQVKTVPGTELKNLVQGNMPYLKAAPY